MPKKASPKTTKKHLTRKMTSSERHQKLLDSLSMTAKDVTAGLLGMLEGFSEDVPEEGAFLAISDAVTDELRATGGIGTLSEKSTHAVLKRLYSGSREFEEIPFEGFVCDVALGDANSISEIYEIQTRSFYAMRRKLAAFLPKAKVTIIYPVVHRSTVSWVDPLTGEITPPARSPKMRFGYGILPELYAIRDFLGHPNLSFRMEFLQVEAYKMLDGFGPSRKLHATKNDGIPKALPYRVSLETPSDYLYFLPDHLPETFTANQYATATRVDNSVANKALTILLTKGLVERIGKQGNAFLYRRK